MRQIKKIMAMFSICLSMALVVPCIAPTLSTSVTVEAATKVKLNKKKAYVTKGEKIQLKVSGTKKTVKWSSSNKKIATVSSKGTVKGLKKGTVTITAKVGDEKYTCKVTVESPKISESKVTVYKGKKITLSMKNTKQTVKWTSSNKKVATVNSKGSVKGIKKGTATITAKVGNKKYTCKITVKNSIALKSISLNKSKLTLEVDDEYQLKVKYNPSNTTIDKSVEWRSSNEDVIVVDEDGYLYAWDAGTATITAKVGGKKATCKVTVKEPIIDVESISLNKTSLSIYLDETYTLEANVFPSYATDTTVTWSSSNENVAKIDSKGQVKAIGVGEATITAKSNNGETAQCKVTVKAKAVEEIALDKTSLELDEGDTAILTADITPNDATDKTVTWTTSNSNVATVDDGEVSAISCGEATITATANDGSGKKASCVVTVKQVPKLELKNTLPTTISYLNYSGTRIYSTVNITDMTYEFEKLPYSKRINLHIYLSGKKIYDRNGSSVSSTSYVGYKIYDSAGNVAYSGCIYKSGLAVGDTFANTEEVIYDVPIDYYTIELLDYQ